jgi:hypothetical protein
LLSFSKPRESREADVKKMNQAKLLMGTLSLLVVAVVISCTRNLSVPVTAVVNTPTATTTKTATPTNTSTGPTFTFTNTATLTYTSTQTNTVTATPTNTLTGPTATFTNTGTSTDTPTITNTFTMTDTPTITNTPTLTATFTNTGTYTNTPTPTNTVAGPPPTATPTCNPNVLFTAFSTAFWSGWTSGGANGYVLSVYTQNCTYSSTTDGSQNTTTVQGSATGALDINCTWTAPSANLLEATIESDYGSNVDATGGSGTNPTAVAFWIYSTNMPLAMAKVWVDAGSNYNVANTTAIPQATWTYVYQLIAPTGVPAGAMSATKAMILDMTSTTVGQTDVLYDNITFCP